MIPAHFPLRFDPDSYREQDVEEIRTWWMANKHQPDSFFFDGTTDYSKPPVWEDPPWFKRTPEMAPWPLPPDAPHPTSAPPMTNASPLQVNPNKTPAEAVNNFWLPFLLGTCLLLSIFLVLIKRSQN